VSEALRLRRGPAAAEPPAAWLLPGADPAGWLEDLAEWGVPLGGLRLYPLPGGGALLPAPRDATGPPSPRAIPFACRADALYLPAEARLEPAVADAELRTALAGDVAVLDPAGGLVRFDRDDALGLLDLVRAPGRREAAWSAPPRGPAPWGGLARIEPAAPPTLEGLVAAGRGDIGTRSPDRLPPDPRGGGAGAGGDAGTEGAGGGEEGGEAGGAAAGAGAAPVEGRGDAEGGDAADAAGRRGFLGRFFGWLRGEGYADDDAPPSPAPPAGPPAAPDPADVQRARERELERLCELLERDPDQGLRYALPLEGKGGRGRAPAGRPPDARLPERDVRLDLDRAGGGLRGRDPWRVRPDLHLELRRRYREVAGRELRLGRHRRAAYIFLELLGDERAAAQALEQGRHFREAALVYGERLGRPLDAALCLERGGLLLEAAELYAREGEPERAGDVFARLERHEDARACYREAVEHLRHVGDLRAAARLLGEKVADTDAALRLLASTWPGHRQAARCLDDRFELLARSGRHEEAAALVRELSDVPAPPRRAADLVESLARVATVFPAEAVQERAADAARVTAGRRIPAARPAEVERLVGAVARLAPGDLLLLRDARRYVARVRTGGRQPRRRFTAGAEPVVVTQFVIPGEAAWEAIAARADLFYAVGRGSDGAVAARGSWDGVTQTVAWGGLRGGQLLVAPPVTDGGPVAVACCGGDRLALRRFPADDQLGPAARVGTPRWLPEAPLALTTSPAGACWVVHGNEHALLLSAYDAVAGGAVVGAQLLAGREVGLGPLHLGLLARRDRLFVAVGATVQWRDGATVVQTSELDADVTGLTASPVAPLLVATHADGATALWSRRGPAGETRLARGLSRPRAAFTRDGLLVLAGEGEVRTYRVGAGTIAHEATSRGLGSLLELLPTRGARQLAVVSPGGWVRVVQLPE